MQIRHMFDTVIIIGIVALFMVQIINFVGRMNDTLTKAQKLLNDNNTGIDHFSESYLT